VVFLNERNNPVDGYRVTFELPNGVIDWIDLPKAQYSDANIKTAIDKAVKLHESILK
jgi:hypothetical protein